MRILTATVALGALVVGPMAVGQPAVAVVTSEVATPDFRTQAWIVADADSGDILAGQAYDVQRAPASTLKTLTALTLLPRLQYDSTYQATAAETLTEGAQVGVLAGNSYTVAELAHGMLMRSGNDAAVALANAYGYQRTLAAMNAEAQRIGATSTVAKSPNGLDRDGQVSTAADLAQIFRAAIDDERIQAILTTEAAQFPGRPPIQPTVSRGYYTIYNNDSLLGDDYPGFLGAKTGFTSQAGRSYVAGAQRDGRTLVVALLGIGGGTTQTARRVLDWSFENIGALTPIGQLPELPKAEQISPEPAADHPDDMSPTPPDAQTIENVAQVAQAAMAAAQSAASIDAVVSEDPALSAQAAADRAMQEAESTQATIAGTTAQEAVTAAAQAGELPAPPDPQQVAAEAVAAANQAAGVTVVETASGVRAAVGVAGPSAAAEPTAPLAPEGRGFFATLLVGLFRAFMWLLLLSGIAVVGLRIRAVRRQRARREAYLRAMQQRVAENLPEGSTFRRDPVQTR